MPRSHWMKTLLAVALPLGFASCTAPQPMQKPGSDNATTEKDTAECRSAAQEEAVRLHPHGASIPTLGGAGIMMSQQRDSNERAVAEARAFQACMQNKGYSRPAAK
jgi:uncharacterized membrane protein